MDIRTFREQTPPVLSQEDWIQILNMLAPKHLSRDSNMFDVGYERAKQNILDRLINIAVPGKNGTVDPTSLGTAWKIVHE